MKTIGFLIIVVSVFFAGIVKSQDAQEIIRKVQAKYDKINDAKATFSQSIKGSGSKASNSSGTIYIKKGNQYRIETGGQIVITDGKTSWSYSPKKKQVVVDNYRDDANTFSPNKFLFNYPENFYSDTDGEETISGVDTYVIKLTPRNKGSVKSARIWIDKGEYVIRKIQIITNESTSVYTLKDVSLDAGVSGSLFSFNPPGGVEVIDLR